MFWVAQDRCVVCPWCSESLGRWWMEKAVGDLALVIVAKSFVLRLLLCSPKKVDFYAIKIT